MCLHIGIGQSYGPNKLCASNIIIVILIKLVACLFLCSVIRICTCERFWSRVVGTLARMAVRLRYVRAWSTCIYKHSSNTYCNMFTSASKMDSLQDST